MELRVREGNKIRLVPATEGMTVLQALATEGVHVDAPCGGGGTCKKCTMLISDDTGTSYRLACATPVKPGMEVTVEESQDMAVSLAGQTKEWAADGKPGTYGLAFDIGTTTIVGRLHNLENGKLIACRGCANPQLPFGADVISRISCCEDGYLEAMEKLVGEKLVSLSRSMMKSARISGGQIANAVIAGNTTMLHIAAGLDPTPIGVSPFTPQTLFGETIPFTPFAEAGIGNGKALFAPCVAGYVGGDITCGILACDMLDQEQVTLLLDLGTNGEMALGNKDGIVTCATAAGPVFEGANVKYGMPAYPGAISQVRLSTDGDLEFTIIEGAEPVGICGTGLFDIVALLLGTGIIDETGRIVDDDELDDDVSQALIDRLCEEDDAPAFRLIGNIVLTQKDVRSLQLAKASVCAGIETMLEETGTELDAVSDLVIAGGFGQYLNLINAALVGIFPQELTEKARSVGNTSIEGATALLLSSASRNKMGDITKASTYVELSGHKIFNERYVEDMMFE